MQRFMMPAVLNTIPIQEMEQLLNHMQSNTQFVAGYSSQLK